MTQFFSSLLDDFDFWEYFVRHLFRFFSAVSAFWENTISPCLNAPRFTPFPTERLVTPIFETCNKAIGFERTKKETSLEQLKLIFKTQVEKRRQSNSWKTERLYLLLEYSCPHRQKIALSWRAPQSSNESSENVRSCVTNWKRFPESSSGGLLKH